ncbi:MAG: CDP-glucose 4,6-dehydratase [PVC group bacterium]|nr:CDP-glucose 4,6-dehydratase [PVC group bacterium]
MIDIISKYKNKRVLVTGHTGFKGSWMSLWLSQLGAKVIGYSLEPPTSPSLFEAIGLKKQITHIIADINDQKRLDAVFKKYRPQVVFHLAAQPLVRLSYKSPVSTYQTNVMGTVNVLEAVRKTKSVRACLVVTSDKCYENKEWIYGYRESDPMGGYDPYSSSKGCAELVVSAYRNSFFAPKEYGKAHSVSLASARSGNIIGGGDWGEDRLVPDCVRALSKNKTIMIRNPYATRPWQYVLEPLSGYLLLGGRMLEDAVAFSGPWNFGPSSNEALPVKDIVKLVLSCWGDGKYKIERGRKAHEAHLLQLDASKAHKLLGWKSVYSMNEKMTRTVNWYKKFYDNMGKSALLRQTSEDIDQYVKRISVLD